MMIELHKSNPGSEAGFVPSMWPPVMASMPNNSLKLFG